MSDDLQEVIEAPKRKLGRPPKVKRAAPEIPRLGTPASGKWLVDEIAKAFPDAKPTDWRAVMTMMQYAMRHGRYWGQLKRGE